MIALILIAVLAQAQTPTRDARPTAETGTAVIAGTVTSDEARPVPLRRVRVTLIGPGMDVPRTAITTDDGRFLFDGLTAGMSLWRPKARPAKYAPVSLDQVRTMGSTTSAVPAAGAWRT